MHIRTTLVLCSGLVLAACGGEDPTGPVDAPMGKHVVYVARDGGEARDGLFLLDTADPGRVIARLNPRLGGETGIDELSARPDGARLAYVVSDASSTELHLLDPLQPGRAQRVSERNWLWVRNLRWAGEWLLADLTVEIDAGALTIILTEDRLVAIHPDDPSRVVLLYSDRLSENFDSRALPLNGGAFAYLTRTGLFHRDAPTTAPRTLATAAEVESASNIYASPDGEWLVLGYADGVGTLRAVRRDGTGGLIDLPPGSISHVLDDGVIYVPFAAPGGTTRLYRVSFTAPTVFTELTPAALDGSGVTTSRLSPSADQLALTFGLESDRNGLHTIDLATPGVVTQRYALAADELSLRDYDYAEDGAALVVTTVSAAPRVLRVGARDAAAPLVLASNLGAGEPTGLQVCDDGVTIVFREAERFPPGTGGVPESPYWLSELQAGRADTAGTRRITPGLPEFRGVTNFACLPTRVD